MKKLLILVGLFILQQQVFAQNYKFQALFIFNIAHRIEWPSLNNEFVIGVIGSKELQSELEAISTKRQLYGHTLRVKQLSGSDPDLSDCNIVYIGRSSSSKISKVKTAIHQSPILLIADKQGAEGVHINFIDKPGKIEFEIYPSSIKTQDLVVSNSLLNLGIVRN